MKVKFSTPSLNLKLGQDVKPITRTDVLHLMQDDLILAGIFDARVRFAKDDLIMIDGYMCDPSAGGLFRRVGLTLEAQ